MVLQPLTGEGLLIVEDSRSHSDAARSVGILWTRDRLVAETSTLQQTSMPPAGFEPTIPASERLQTHALVRAATGSGPGCVIPIAFP